MSLNIVFAGTPEFAVPSLTAIIESSEHKVTAVYTQPDAPSGRGQKLQASPVKQYALSKNIPVFQPISLRNAEAQTQLKSLSADIMVVIAYGQILSEAVLQMFRFGCINVHASLLPRWRGAAPIQRAILAGDSETGNTIMQMEKGLDTGPMLTQIMTPIYSTDTGGSVHDRLSILGSEALLTVLSDIEKYLQQAKVQDDTLASYAHKLTKQEGQIDWQKTAIELERQVRAFTPWPGSFCYLGETRIHIHQASVIAEQTTRSPGTIVDVAKEGIDISTGQYLLRLTKLQFPGGKPLPVSDILNAKPTLFQANSCLA